MSLSLATAVAGPYYPNGSTTEFDFGFKVATAAEVEVVRVSSAGAETIVSSLLYTVALAEDGEGGTVTYALAPILADGSLYIRSKPLFTQTASFTNSGFLPTTLNPVVDRAAIRDLYLKHFADRAMLSPIGESSLVLPLEADRLNTVLGFHETTGKPVAWAISASQLQSLADAAAAIVAVAGIKDELLVVYGDIVGDGNIEVVAQNILPVVAVGLNIAAVLAVNANATNINALAADLLGADTIGDVAAVAPQVANLAAFLAEILAVNNSEAAIQAVAADLGGANTIGIAAGNIATIISVANSLNAIISAYDNIALITSAPANAALARDWASKVSGEVDAVNYPGKLSAYQYALQAEDAFSTIPIQLAEIVSAQVIIENTVLSYILTHP